MLQIMIIRLMLCLIAYLIGAIPTSYIIVKILKKIDIRNYGSKNVGATNAGRLLGKRWFFIITLLDIIKGMLPIFITMKILNIFDNTNYFLFIIGIITVIGHTFPVYLRFKGGKGVAVSVGVFLILDYRLFLIGLCIFLIVVLLTRYISAGSITASLSLPVAELILYHKNQNYYILGITIFISIYITYKHKNNIKRLLKGTERKWGERI